MAQKTRENLKVVKLPDMDKLRQNTRKIHAAKLKRWGGPAIILVLAVIGTFLLIGNHSYHVIVNTTSYTRETTDTNYYVAFGNGIICYNRDGVTFLSRQNEEQWIQSGEFQNPVIDVNGESFAIGDAGGNSIQVFTSEGLKGEFETTLPIEKIAVSSQGVVSAILKNGDTPSVVTYDAVGNILAENNVNISGIGYPTAVEMSSDGTVLMVSYLDTGSSILKSRVICYNFGDAGAEAENHQVGSEEYEDVIIPELFYMNDSTAVAVSDNSFILYSGGDSPEKIKEVSIGQEIRSVFHTEKYIGFVLLNEEKSGYEVRLYNRSGTEIMEYELSGEYSNVEMKGNDIFLYEGSNLCIIRKNGVLRYEGDMGTTILGVFPGSGINKYLVMDANELQVIYLAI